MGAYGSAQSLAHLALEAETAGWDAIFVWDSVQVDLENRGNRATYDPWIALAAMAANTSRIRLGTMITPIARRRPWKLARETVTLDHLSGGRLILPVGLGAVEDGAFFKVGEELDRRIRAEKLDEGLEILAGLWSGQPFSFEGKHYQSQEMTFLPRPIQQPRIPVWVVGAWPREKSIRRAIHWDGILPVKMTADGQSLADDGYAQAGGMTPDDVREMKAYVDQRRTLDRSFDIILEGDTAGGDSARAAGIVRPYAQAGATWWVEAVWKFFYSDPGDVEVVRQRIRQGPPRVD
jgi:alkanesulfonate monooxygenase SsuD/methylene tetrahydromethanopterin reductase-like flavin-dependent oxidoreductase (luciferase family)